MADRMLTTALGADAGLLAWPELPDRMWYRRVHEPIGEQLPASQRNRVVSPVIVASRLDSASERWRCLPRVKLPSGRTKAAAVLTGDARRTVGPFGVFRAHLNNAGRVLRKYGTVPVADSLRLIRLRLRRFVPEQ